MKIILLGSEGQLGYEFKSFLENKEILYSFNHKELDILDFEKVKKIFYELEPEIVINCAAYTNVELAEEERDKAYLINTVGAKIVSFLSYKIKAKVIYFSTDYVFNGNKNYPYTELDQPNPISIYGKSKLYGEYFTKLHNPNHLILRISWLYGIRGNNFIKKILNLSKKEKLIKVVNDQFGTPTYTLDIVKQTYELIKRDFVGLYHSSNEGFTNWFEYSLKIKELFNLTLEILPIKSDELYSKVKRPKYSVLENYFLKLENINIMRNWEEALIDFIFNYKEELIGY